MGANLHIQRHGHGCPVLVLHGGLGWDHTSLRPGLDGLGDALEVIYFDHRGNGRSAEPAQWDEVGIETWVQDADAVRTSAGHERVVVFGHSYGGLLAQHYALRYPDRVAGLILCAAYPALDYVPAALALAESRATLEQFATLQAAFTAPPATDAALGEVWRAIVPLYFHEPEPERLRAFDQTVFRAAAFSRGNACLPEAATVGRLAAIRAPTLILAGADDWIAPVTHGAARLIAEIPGATLHVFDHSGHFLFLEETAAFQRVVREWLAAHVPEFAAARLEQRGRPAGERSLEPGYRRPQGEGTPS